jgi:hypothetical protein
MNVNFGLFPVLPEPEGLTRGQVREWKSQREPLISRRALGDLSGWLDQKVG